jgi:uncharacterized protein DUF6542
VAANHRSMISTIPGVPSWGAVLIAFTFTAIGFAFDAGSAAKELTTVFAGGYVIGCVAAVIAVRQSSVFTAVIQPPLLLFVTVPGAYFLFHSGTVDGLKDLLINCGYPLIERFPLMFFTTAIVLLIGLVRWYLGMASRRGAPAEAEPAETESRFSAVTSKISGLLAKDSEDGAEPVEEAPPRRRAKQHSIDRAPRTGRTTAQGTRTRNGKPTKRTQPSRSRHNRPPETEIIEPVAERPRRPRPARRTTDPTVPPAEPRRRPRASSAREPRKTPPPTERRSPYQRPDRHSRFDGFEPFEPHGTNGSNGTNGSHHPVSRVRYRGADAGEERTQHRTRPRAPKHQADAWEYDV